jgi:tRNA threonylcarbamoyl adenosine modification protein YeaZ
MTNFITVQNSYHDVQISLSQDSITIDQACASKIDASKMLAPMIGAMPQKNQKDFSSLKFIAANYGPGPFTTLRTVLATVNGLGFATGLPLIGIDALDAMIFEHQKSTSGPLVVLLNAFNQDVYFAIAHGGQIERGCKKGQLLIIELAEKFPQEAIRFTGNGSALHKEFIQSIFGPRAIIAEPITESPSIETIAQLALAKWQRQDGLETQLLPVYMK